MKNSGFLILYYFKRPERYSSVLESKGGRVQMLGINFSFVIKDAIKFYHDVVNVISAMLEFTSESCCKLVIFL